MERGRERIKDRERGKREKYRSTECEVERELKSKRGRGRIRDGERGGR